MLNSIFTQLCIYKPTNLDLVLKYFSIEHMLTFLNLE